MRIVLWQLTIGQTNSTKLNDKFVLVIHGAAGTITKESMIPEKEKAFNEALNKALAIGYDACKKGRNCFGCSRNCRSQIIR
ncbi:MAG: hypothetical protein ACM3H8_00565 [Sphingobacteriales bacterium]